MANYCFTSYIVEGKRETLEQIKNVINAVTKRYEDEKNYNCNLMDIFIGLGLYTEESLKEATKDYTEDTPEGLGIAGDWRNAELKEINGQEVLTFREEYKWNCSCNMETLSNLDAFKNAITGVYRYSEEGGCGIYETTDREGKYFPEKYILMMDVSEDDCIEEKFMTLEDVQKIVHKHYPEISEKATIKKMEAYAAKYDFCLSCNKIEGASGIPAGTLKKIAQQIVEQSINKQ